jgi:hypothetical protein
MKSYIYLVTGLAALGSGSIASAGEPMPNCAGWWARLRACCTSYTRPHCGCPDDYYRKPFPPASCRYCPAGCDSYDRKPLPPVSCRYCPRGCDYYDWKPYPCISTNCRWWYTCGSSAVVP